MNASDTANGANARRARIGVTGTTDDFAFAFVWDGGKQTAWTLGLNWYPNDLVQFMVDFSHVDYDKANGASGLPLGAPVGTSFDALSFRARVAC